MKAYKQIIRQYIVLSLLVIQQVTGLVHLTYMPRIRDIDYRQQSASIDFLHKNRNSGLPRALFQRSFHSNDQNGRKSFTAPSKILVLFFAFFLSAIAASVIFNKSESYLGTNPTSASLSYLSLCKLRI